MGQMIGSHNVPTEDQQIQDEEYWGYDVKTVEEITKPKLGKLIIDYCGNEGTTDNEQTASIRKLLQRAITNLEPLQKQYPGVWRDAELKIFDLYGNGYVVRSGEGSVKFVAQITGNGDVELSKVNDQSFWASIKALLRRPNSKQLQIEGPQPDQSNARQGWFPLKSSHSIPWPFSRSKPERNQEGGLSQSSTEHDESSLDSPSVMESDGKVAADDQHGNDSLIGHDEGGEIQNNNPCSYSAEGTSPQSVDHSPESASGYQTNNNVKISPNADNHTDTREEVAKRGHFKAIISLCLLQENTDE